MRVLFADTFFYLAYLVPAEDFHEAARAFARRSGITTVTTAWVITELLDAFAYVPKRTLAVELVSVLENNSLTTIVPPTQELMQRGQHLYRSRQDKDWSLTDCISFVVM